MGSLIALLVPQANAHAIGGIRWLFAVARAQVLLAEARSILVAIHRRSNQPFREWLVDAAVDDLESQLQDIRTVAEGESAVGGPERFSDYVRGQLAACSEDDIVLALCGDKGLSDDQTAEYFERFYEYRVVRIFVECPRFDNTTRNAIRAHNDAGDNVMALVIDNKQRQAFTHDFPRICDSLHTGFGYVVFIPATGVPFAVVHEGPAANFAHGELRDASNLDRILWMYWRFFANAEDASVTHPSRDGKPNKAPKDKLDTIWREVVQRLANHGLVVRQ